MLVGKKIGPFTIDKELGAGAMGAVYRARHAETGQCVAIKIVAPGLATNETAMKRFKREADILKQLKHPNIVRLVLAGKFGGTPFYAMEYIEGESLDRVMARRGRISWEEVVTLGSQLCEALKHAHDQGIIHRDLKPSNVMVLPNGTLKLTDFGIAKDMDSTALTSANCTVGTAAYMSPEQCRGERNLTHKSDLYSLGIMFYELVTGQKPFQADNPMDMFMQHTQGTFERPRRLVLDIPVWLDNLVSQLLEKKPEQRPYDANAVAAALDRIKEKVEAQQSAGMDVVKSRASERPEFDDEDKEAARTLLGKKKKKKKATPFYRQRWFQAVLYATLLLAILAVFYVVFLKRPSADALYAEASKAKAAEKLQERVDARAAGALADFLRYYPDDPRAAEVRRWADAIDRDKVETELVTRYREEATVGVTGDEERGRAALKQEEGGHPEQARATWQKFLKFKGAADTEKNGYALLAERRIEALKWLTVEDARLSSHVNKEGPVPEFKATNNHETKAAAAYQAALKDPAKGRAAWQEFQKGLDRDNPEERPWYLLAAKYIQELPAPAAPAKKETSLRLLSAPAV